MKLRLCLGWRSGRDLMGLAREDDGRELIRGGSLVTSCGAISRERVPCRYGNVPDASLGPLRHARPMASRVGTSEVVEGVEYRYSSGWTHGFESETRWRLYWRQQKLMRDLLAPGDRVLEIGIGTQFVANYLRSKGISVTTLDIDADKHPEIVANIALYEFPTSYDAILAFQVFEHMPYEDFEAVLPRLAAAARRQVFISVPRNRRTDPWRPTKTAEAQVEVVRLESEQGPHRRALPCVGGRSRWHHRPVFGGNIRPAWAQDSPSRRGVRPALLRPRTRVVAGRRRESCRGFLSGRGWDRTSDLPRVKRALSR